MPEPTYELLSVEYSPTKTAGNRGPYLYKVKCSLRQRALSALDQE